MILKLIYRFIQLEHLRTSEKFDLFRFWEIQRKSSEEISYNLGDQQWSFELISRLPSERFLLKISAWNEDAREWWRIGWVAKSSRNEAS